MEKVFRKTVLESRSTSERSIDYFETRVDWQTLKKDNRTTHVSLVVKGYNYKTTNVKP